MAEFEVIVVGAGPGGSAVALRLARRGHSVLLLDRARFPRPKVCGEGLMPIGVREADALLPGLSAHGHPFRGIRYVVGEHAAEADFPGGHVGRGMHRGRLDLHLLQACVQAGVEVRTGRSVTTVDGTGGRRVVRTSEGSLRCRAIIVADGMRSPLRRRLGLQRSLRGRPRFGLRAHVRLRDPSLLPRVVEVRVGRGVETYLTPVGPDEVNVAVLLEKSATRGLKGDLEGGFAQIVDQDPRLRRLLADAEPAGDLGLTGPLRQEAIEVVADGVLLVGDAAGFLDGITGEGMSLTLTSARLAADVLHGALRDDDLSARRLAPYAAARRRAARDLTLLTEIVLAGIRNRRLARRVVAGLARHPDVFQRILGVSTGGRVSDVGLAGLARVLVA